MPSEIFITKFILISLKQVHKTLIIFCSPVWEYCVLPTSNIIRSIKIGFYLAKKIYISQIPDFNQMFTASSKLIIAKANIDSTGKFKIAFTDSKWETLYRLHIVKKNEPAATLTIGGEDENYVFFIAKDLSQVYLKASDNGKILNQINIKDGKSNDELNSLLKLISDNSISRDSLKDQLVVTAEKSNSELVGLLAVYSAFGLDVSQKSRIKNALKKGIAEKIFMEPEYLKV